MPDIAAIAFCSANRALHCAMDKPKGEGDCRSPNDAEHARASDIPRVNATLGARLVTIEELPGNHLA